MERVNSGPSRLKMALTFSLVIHLAAVLLIFYIPQAKKESGSPFITRLITPDEMRKEFPAEPPVKSLPRGNARTQARVPARPALPRVMRPPRQIPVIPAPTPKAEEKRAVPDNRGSMSRELPSQGSRVVPPVVPGGVGSRGTTGSRIGPAIPKPGPSLREKLFDTEVMGKVAKREEKEHDNGITFDTKEFKYESYMMKLKERIEGIWKYPPEAAMRGIHGDLLIRFTIEKNGRLSDVELLRTSGYRDLDEAAMQALKDGAPYWPLPDEWGRDELPVTGHFVYSNYGAYIR